MRWEWGWSQIWLELWFLGGLIFLTPPSAKHINIWHLGSGRGKKGSKILGTGLRTMASCDA